MKKVFSLLVFLTLPLGVAAQGLHGRIFILGDSIRHYQYPLEAFLPTFYLGTIDSGFSLPSSLDQFDAIFDFQGSGSSGDTLSTSSQLQLIDYIAAGGKFYAPGFLFLRYSKDNPLGDTLWHFCGDSEELCEALFVWYDSIYGVDSEFTSGISIGWQHPDPTQFDGSPCDMLGPVQPVMWEHEGNDGVDDPIAWIPLDHSKHIVLSVYGVPAAFYPKMICDYFGLCTDVVSEAPKLPVITLRVISDGNQTWLEPGGTGTGELSLANELGVDVFRTMIRNNEHIPVPGNLPGGVYFARLGMNGQSVMRSFAIIRN